MNQSEFFRSTGFLKLPKILNDCLLNSAIARIDKVIQNSEKPYRLSKNRSINRIDQLYQRDICFQQIMAHPGLMEFLVPILGPNIELVLNRHNHATVNTADDVLVRLHRDVLQWSRSLVTAIFYLEDSDMDSAPTMLIPSSHYLPFVGTPNNGGTWMDEHSVYGDLAAQAISIPMRAGSVLIFDSLVFHTVGPNYTNRSRMSIAAGYHSVNELEPNKFSQTRVLVHGENLYRGNDV